MTPEAHMDRDLRLTSMWLVARNEGQIIPTEVGRTVVKIHGCSEPRALDVVETLLQDGWLAVDVGANGQFFLVTNIP